jgi:predicted hydrocarbon binding protein
MSTLEKGVFSLEKASEKSLREFFLIQFETFGQIENALELIFSPSAASVILHTAAIKCGVHSYKKISKVMKTKQDVLNQLSKLKCEENWGNISFMGVDFKRGSGKIRIDNSFEAIARKNNQLGCYFFRGFLTGFLSELFKKSVTVTEEKCMGKGSPNCEFTFN